MNLWKCLIIWIDMLSLPCALPTFRFFIVKFVLSSVKVIFSICLLVLNFKEGWWLLLITGVHWEAKYEFKSSTYFGENWNNAVIDRQVV